MAIGTTRDRTAVHGRSRMSPILMATNLLIWISSVIVMGITAWLVSENNGNAANRVIYILVIVCTSPHCWQLQTNTFPSPS